MDLFGTEGLMLVAVTESVSYWPQCTGSRPFRDMREIGVHLDTAVHKT